jgi:hypothetical protein
MSNTPLGKGTSAALPSTGHSRRVFGLFHGALKGVK